jgi:hypothetical protein
MDPNVLPMTVAMIISVFNFWVAMLNTKIFERDMAKFFIAANFVLGVLNLTTAIKYAMM